MGGVGVGGGSGETFPLPRFTNKEKIQWRSVNSMPEQGHLPQRFPAFSLCTRREGKFSLTDYTWGFWKALLWIQCFTLPFLPC